MDNYTDHSDKHWQSFSDGIEYCGVLNWDR